MNLPLDECKAFLIKECMSEEEDNEFYPNSNTASSLKVIVPTWRSEKVTYPKKNEDKKKKKKRFTHNVYKAEPTI